MIAKKWHGLVLLAFSTGLYSGLGSTQPFDSFGRSEVIGDPESDWVFIGSSLVDVVDNEFLGLVSIGGMGSLLQFSPDDRSIFAVETFRSRGTRGERTDTVTVFDTSTLGAVGEVIIPSKTALMGAGDGAAAMSDDDRFLAVFNLTPATSLSIVDTERLEFVVEISTPGCSLVYGAGERRYVMLCANGGLLTVTLDEEGGELSKVRTEGFFDPEVDPVREGGVRYGDELLFVSFEGMLHPLDVSGSTPQFGETWSLLTEQDRADNWRIAGRQHLSVHQETGRLYSLVRQSDEPLDDPGDMDGLEIWVYDLETRERVQRLEAIPEREESGGGGGGRGIGSTSGDGASRILVTQGDDPLLVTVGGGISVRDALSGEYIHETLENVPADGRLTLRLP